MEAWIAPAGAGAAGSGAGVGACPLLDALSGKRLGGAKLLSRLLNSLLSLLDDWSRFRVLPKLRLLENDGSPGAPGWFGCWKLCPWCGPGWAAFACPRLPPVFPPAAADTVACCAFSFAICSLSFSRSKNSASSYRVNCWVFLRIVASLSGNAILSLGSKIVSLTNVSYVGRLCICALFNFICYVVSVNF